MVRLEKGSGFNEDIDAATITLGNDNLVTSGSFVASTGTFTPDASGTGTITLAENAGTSDYSAIVVPQAISGKKINITIQDKTQSYSILTPEFEAGKRYTYILTLGSNGDVIHVSSEITDWVNNEFTQSM